MANHWLDECAYESVRDVVLLALGGVLWLVGLSLGGVLGLVGLSLGGVLGLSLGGVLGLVLSRLTFLSYPVRILFRHVQRGIPRPSIITTQVARTGSGVHGHIDPCVIVRRVRKRNTCRAARAPSPFVTVEDMLMQVVPSCFTALITPWLSSLLACSLS